MIVFLCIIVLTLTICLIAGYVKVQETIGNLAWENSVHLGKVLDRILKIEEKLLPDTSLKRSRASLRNPLKTYEQVENPYDSYKGFESNLYEPVKPKRKTTRDEVDV